jgi:hypothetical protein
MNTDARALKLLRDTQQLTGHPEDADDQLVEGRLMDHHTALPGIVQSFNKDDQTAEVQPAIRRLLLPEGQLVTLPLCVKVPCYFPGGAVTFEIKSGDDCALMVSERAIDAWWKKGGVQDPTELRSFDLTDSFAFVGFQSLPQALQDLHATATELRTRSGLNRISVRADGTIHLGTMAALSTLLPPTSGVCLASGIEPLTELPGFLLGWSSQTVMAKP